MCKKSSCVVSVILLIIIVCLCTYIFLCTDFKGKDDKSNDNDTVEKNSYTYDDMKGYYSIIDTNPKKAQEKELSDFKYTLYLSENGTFRYQYVMNTASSVMGNYIIVDDEVRLNYLFNGGNDAGINATNGSKVLKIKDKNTLVDSNAHFASQGGSKSINLVRDNSNSYSLNEFDLNYLVNNYGLFNNATR